MATGIYNIQQAALLQGTGNWPLPSTTSVNYMIVGGGGGGGFGVQGGAGYAGGGAGAGGYLTGSSLAVTPGTLYNIVIGTGGYGSISPYRLGATGGDSSFNGLTASGGGGGASVYNTGVPIGGANGGSGGGGASSGGSGGTGVSGQGYAGGTGSAGSYSGGGGGAGGAASAQTAGIGVSNSITGVAQYYAGGGGGVTMGNTNINMPAGGSSVGGMGSFSPGASGTSACGSGGWAVQNTGSGGGGTIAGFAGTGANGIVVITHPLIYNPAAVQGNCQIRHVGSNIVYIFLGTGSIIF
jgi:hypothetical protein